jgi:glycosyltransferase involved in cell wall biosynthesis
MGIRVLYIDHTARLGGGEIALANLVHFINRERVEPIVLLFEDGPLVTRLRPATETHILELDSSVSTAQKDGLGLGSVLKLKLVWLTLGHVLRVRKLIKTLNPDVIHTNSLKADLIGGIAGRLAGVPVVWHIRDRIDVDYLPKAVVAVFRFLSRVIPAFVIANSKATLETVQLNGRRPSAAIGSGVNLHKYEKYMQDADPAVTRVPESYPRLGLVGRISPWKGQHIFLKAAAEVLKRFPTATFEIIGSALFDEQGYEKTLHDLCTTLQIEESVNFVGFVEDVPARVAALDILVHASTTGEPYGQVIIEGMAAGKPVIATNGGGVPEIVMDQVTGILVPMGNAEKMAEAIEYLLDNPGRMATMGRLGRERVLEHFTAENTARRVEAVYEQMLSDKQSESARSQVRPGR